MTPREPNRSGDADDRERIRTDMGVNLFVEAGAGTGKTHELVERVIELVASGALADVRGLAAITFTEKAATELRDRIRRGLEAASVAGDDAIGPGADERRQRCRDALEVLDDAPVGTLHGFALRILGEFPIEAGLPPGFELRDPVAAAIDFSERWARWVDELFADDELEAVLRRAFVLDLRLAHLREVAAEFHEHWDRLVDHPIDGGTTVVAPVEVQSLIEAVDAAVIQTERCEPDDKLAARVRDELSPYLERLRESAAAGDQAGLLTLLVADGPTFKYGGVGARNAVVDELRERVAEVKEVLSATVGSLRRAVLLPLLARVRAFTLEGAAERQRLGRLEFADLLVHAVHVLERDERVRTELGRRWPVVLVDEFQDTDPLQIRIATLLTLDDPRVVPARWEDSVCRRGRLFVVGDPKQSIYRFRRADIALYDRAKDTFGTGAVQLTRNFRTVPQILDWINEVFGRMFGEGIREKQPEYRPLMAARSALVGASAPVVVLGGPREVSRVSEVRDTEARHIASYVAEVVRGGEVVADGDGSRLARYDDVAILLPTRTSLSEIERALDAVGVPYRIESRSLVFDSDEVRELLTILRAVDHPGDAVSLVGALRTPAFGCSDRDLAEYRWADGPWSVRLRSPDEIDPANPVPAAIAAIGHYHELRQWLPVNELLERIIRERGMVELTLARPRPRDHWRRYRLLLDEARAFVAGGGVSLGEFVGWAEQQADEQASRVEAIVPESDDEAVRILTVHAAKGLEFPITLVAGLNGEIRTRNSRVLWSLDGDGARPEVRVGNLGARFETAGYQAAADFEKGMDELERQRLLYVAATRACDKLIVSLHHKAGATCHATQLWDQTAPVSHLVELVDPPDDPDPSEDPDPSDDPGADASFDAQESPGHTAPGRSPERPDEPVVDPSSGLADLIDRWSAERQQLLTTAARPWVSAPSGLAARGELASDEPGPSYPEPSYPEPSYPDPSHPDPSHPGRRGRSGTAIGRAVHAVLQVVDLADPTDLDAVAEVQAIAEGVPEHTATVAALASSALSSAAVRDARAGRFWRELYVAAPVGDSGRLVEGYVDLLYETPDGELVVVDYKTDQAATDAELDAAVAHYRWQGAAYAAAVEQAVGRPVARVVFVFAGVDRAVERVIDDLAEARAEVATLLDG